MRVRLHLSLIGLGAIVAAGVWGLLTTPTASAATVTPGVCRAIMIFDRSGSVGNTGIATMQSQVRRLFQPTGLYRSDIQLAFWSFASGGSGSFGYDSPGYGYVTSKGIDSGFDTSVSQLATNSLYWTTNYEQGFGYNGGVQNAATKTIAEKADIIVFMTDGRPNEPHLGLPGFYGDGNFYSVNIARQAALKHLNAGKLVLGGLVGDAIDEPTLAKVINGDQNNTSHLFHISDNYSDLSAQLKQQIGSACDKLQDPCPYNSSISVDDPACRATAEYAVVPTSSVTPTIASPGESVRYDYAMTAQKGTAPSKEWSTVGLKVNPGVDITSLTASYQDSSASDINGVKSNILGRLPAGSASIIDDTPSGTWNGGTITPEEGGIPDTATSGEKYCRILVVKQPTQATTPSYRYSAAACVTVGFKPSIQVSGGDVITGRRLMTDTGKPTAGSIIHTSLSTVRGKTYGSFGEYAARASGAITGFASLSALNGGMTNSSEALRSKLTLANTPQPGFYDEEQTDRMPDTTEQILQQYDRELAPRVSGTVGLTRSMKGLYVASGDIQVNGYQAAAGQTIVIYAPGHTVTIDGNITYTTDRLTSFEQIPQIVIIANKIAINSSVTQVDSWLLADGTVAALDTCADAPEKLSSGVCGSTLTVNGPVMARYIMLKRTAGGNVTSGIPAERFNFRPDTYLWAYAAMKNERRVLTTYTRELSPRF